MTLCYIALMALCSFTTLPILGAMSPAAFNLLEWNPRQDYLIWLEKRTASFAVPNLKFNQMFNVIMCATLLL